MSTALLATALPPTAVIRPLTADDFKAYRALRKRILEIGDGKYFSDSYTREQQFVTDEQWRDWCSEKPEHSIIGTFAGGNLIGVMMITMQEPAESRTVEWEATWLDPEYRKCGVAKMAYQKVQEWTLRAGYQKVIVHIRDGNARSREIRERQGFIYQNTKHHEVWADGSVKDCHFFALNLNKPKVRPYSDAFRSLETTRAFLERDVYFLEKAI